jgi:protein ImuB
MVRLHVLSAERLAEHQAELSPAADKENGDRLAALVDVLRHRLGARNVRRLWPRESHIPERAVRAQPFDAEAPVWPARDDAPLRPLILLVPAEPAEVIALIPEGPPRRFRWRGVTYQVAHAQGPERIAAEWWRDRNPRPTRDYYMVEDEAGRRFWIFREGLYGREVAEPRWFLHGLFA